MPLPNDRIYLASQSPRRRQLLTQMGVHFTVLRLRNAAPRGPDVSELVQPGEPPEDYVIRVAREKALFGERVMRLRNLPAHPVLGADTTVTVDGLILGKPANAMEATAMLLTRLSGRVHHVLTCVALADHNGCRHLLNTSLVHFDILTPAAIAAYCASGEPFDKAGAYGIQGKAAVFVRRIDGSHSGIVGLPVFETAQLLNTAGIHIL